uniref:Homeobox protein 2-like n=1 Tax=Schistosoma mansoni TaxID=6183 RepID=A0A5K4FGN3_SCHMA
MEFHRNNIRQIGYFTPTYSNSPNIKRYPDLLSNYQSESYGLNYLTQLHMAYHFPNYHHGNMTNIVDMEQSNYDNNLNRNPPSNDNNSHVRINHTLDGKTQIIYETPSKTRQYWLDRCKLSSINYIDNNNSNNIDNNNNNTDNNNNDNNNINNNNNIDHIIIINKSDPNQNQYKSTKIKYNNQLINNKNNQFNNNNNNNDLQLYELTENELILSELDPRLNVLNSNIKKINKIKFIDLNQKINKNNEILPIYQSIEHTIYKDDLSPSTISKCNTRQLQQNQRQNHCRQMDHFHQNQLMDYNQLGRSKQTIPSKFVTALVDFACSVHL